MVHNGGVLSLNLPDRTLLDKLDHVDVDTLFPLPAEPRSDTAPSYDVAPALAPRTDTVTDQRPASPPSTPSTAAASAALAACTAATPAPAVVNATDGATSVPATAAVEPPTLPESRTTSTSGATVGAGVDGGGSSGSSERASTGTMDRLVRSWFGHDRSTQGATPRHHREALPIHCPSCCRVEWHAVCVARCVCVVCVRVCVCVCVMHILVSAVVLQAPVPFLCLCRRSGRRTAGTTCWRPLTLSVARTTAGSGVASTSCAPLPWVSSPHANGSGTSSRRRR